MFLAKDKILLEAFRRGERDAMDKVYRHYYKGVYHFLSKGFTFRSSNQYLFFRGIHDPSELSACVQEVFRRAFEENARHAYNGINPFSNWILAIARNMVINQFRNREIAFSDYFSTSSHNNLSRTPLDVELNEEFQGMFYGHAPLNQDTNFENKELKSLIDAFSTQISNEEQQLLLMRFAEGLGQEETARALNSTRMRVRTAESRLKNKLKAFLRNSGYIDRYLMSVPMDTEVEDNDVLPAPSKLKNWSRLLEKLKSS